MSKFKFVKVCWLWADNVTTASKILKLTNSEHVFASVRIYSSLGNSVTHPLMVDAECQCFAKNETVHVRSCSISYNLAQVINNAKMFFDSMSSCQHGNLVCPNWNQFITIIIVERTTSPVPFVNIVCCSYALLQLS